MEAPVRIPESLEVIDFITSYLTLYVKSKKYTEGRTGLDCG